MHVLLKQNCLLLARSTTILLSLAPLFASFQDTSFVAEMMRASLNVRRHMGSEKMTSSFVMVPPESYAVLTQISWFLYLIICTLLLSCNLSRQVYQRNLQHLLVLTMSVGQLRACSPSRAFCIAIKSDIMNWTTSIWNKPHCQLFRLSRSKICRSWHQMV